MKAEDLPLRELKHAQTRLALVNAARRHLAATPLDGLSIKDLCREVQVSEATFFNYFPKKTDLLVYLGQLWTLDVAWHLQQQPAAGGLATIGQVFERTAQQIVDSPGVMAEIVAWQAHQRERAQPPTLTVAERLVAYPDRPGIEDLPDKGLESLLMPAVQKAIDSGELPGNTPLATVMVALSALFFGVPLTLAAMNPKGVASMYRQQLAILWAGLRAAAGMR